MPEKGVSKPIIYLMAFCAFFLFFLLTIHPIKAYAEEPPPGTMVSTPGESDGSSESAGEDNGGSENSVPVLDSGPVPGGDSDIPELLPGSVAEDVAAIRQSLDVLLYVVVPLTFAVIAVILFCRWFNRTFLESAL